MIPKSLFTLGKKPFLRRAGELWPVAKGSLSQVRKPCVRPDCPTCAKGAGHKAFIFVYTHKGRRRCLHVPRELVPILRRAIRNGRKLEQHISEAGAELVFRYRRKR